MKHPTSPAALIEQASLHDVNEGRLPCARTAPEYFVKRVQKGIMQDFACIRKSADPGRRAQQCILCSIQNLVQNPKSKIRNPKSKIRNPKSKIQNPKSEIQNPKSKIRNPKSKIQNPKSKIRNPKFAQKEMLHNAPKSKIRNPKSEIQNPPPKSKIWASHKELLHNDPKSKIPKIRPKKFGFWILDWGILDFGFQILDSGFWILGGSRGCTTRQFSDGAWRSEARIPPGPPTVSDRVGGRKKTRQER